MQNEPKNQEGLEGIGALHHRLPLRYMLSFFFEKRTSACGCTIPESPSIWDYEESKVELEGGFLNLGAFLRPILLKRIFSIHGFCKQLDDVSRNRIGEVCFCHDVIPN